MLSRFAVCVFAVLVAVSLASTALAGVSQFNDSYSGCSWMGRSDVDTTEAHGRTTSSCADYTYRYTQVIDIYGVMQIQNWSGYVAQPWNEYYYGHNDCGEMYGQHTILKNWSGPSTRSTDALR